MTIYTTNAIENFNRQLRKVTKTKSAFVSDDALMKMLYLVTMRVSDKWTMPIQNWASILDNLMIHCRGQGQIDLLTWTSALRLQKSFEGVTQNLLRYQPFTPMRNPAVVSCLLCRNAVQLQARRQLLREPYRR